MEEKIFFEGKFGKICAVFSETSSDKKTETVIIIHGFHSTKNTGAIPISQALNSIGLNTLRFDLDNVGESELDFGTQASIPNYVSQVEAAINYITEKGYKNISLIGTSTGGLVALSTVLNNKEIKRIVLRAPDLNFQNYFNKMFGEKMHEFEKSGKIPHIDRNGKTILFNYKCYSTASKYNMFEKAHLIKQQVLILHGDNDSLIDYHLSEKCAPLFPNSELKIIKGADHSLGINGNYDESLKLLKEFFSQPNSSNSS